MLNLISHRYVKVCANMLLKENSTIFQSHKKPMVCSSYCHLTHDLNQIDMSNL
jgi:hypothetical protein